MAKTAEQIVRDFFAAVDARDIDALVDACTDDVVYENVSMAPHLGKAALRAFVTPNMSKVDDYVTNMRSIATAADGRTVLTERLDVFDFKGSKVHVRVMGAFEIRDGKIAAWRDYFDLASFAAAMKAIGQRAGPGIGEKFS
jgi:limonene-1,2-epoxide hydrolase